MRWGPEFTPVPISMIIGATAILSLFAGLTNSLFVSLLGASLSDFFCLSWYGISHLYIWQPFSYLFLQDTGYNGITLFYLIGLAFSLYIVWIIGSMLWESLGERGFFILYFGSGICAGIVAVLFMPVIGQYSILSGPSAAVLAILMLWTMLHPELELWLFMAIPIKAKWLMVAIVGTVLLIDLSQRDWIGLIHSATGLAWGYGFGLIVNEVEGPFAFTHRFDTLVTNIGNKLRHIKIKRSKTKIIDIESGKPALDDDKFIDEMLAKISRFGEKSLTWSEKQRMNQIAQKKKQKK